MEHALVIEDNIVVSNALVQSLASHGFKSFDCVWDRDQAIAAVEKHRPDLVVIGDSLGDQAWLPLAEEVCLLTNVPALLVTTNKFKAAELIDHASVSGPFHYSDMGDAVVNATRPCLAAVA